MTVNQWIDENMKTVYGHTIRLIDSETKKGVGDMMFMYMDRKVQNVKITSRWIFIFI